MRSPKLSSDREKPWYRYYAGYSRAFVEDALASLALAEESTVLDPWNGSGTTTAVAQELGHRAIGCDANPSLVLVARARLLGKEVAESLDALAEDILDHQKSVTPDGLISEPLGTWLDDDSARWARSLERAVQHVLIDHSAYQPLTSEAALDRVSSLAAFFYVALFDAVRSVVRPFVGSNPTWVKSPALDDRLTVNGNDLALAFREAVTSLGQRLRDGGSTELASITQALSGKLPLEDASVDAVVTSPPYCTRIDYIAATRPELAVLGYGHSDLRALRSAMVGTPTIAAETPSVSPEWGHAATSVISEIAGHTSKASGGYYRKYFVQYFDSLWESLGELRRVTRPGGPLVVVVQDSYYKDVHVDLPVIVSEMCENLGWTAISRTDFDIMRTKAAIHPSSRTWRTRFSAVEAALTLT
jgi:DNA modification methylase